jgi:uncharacterized protein
MGDPQIRIGSVDAEGKLMLQTRMFSHWRSRTVASNPTCESCSYSLHCGGGCAVLAEARNGKYYSNFCDGFASRFRTAVADAYEAYLTEQENQVDSVGATRSFRSKPGCA